MRPTATRRRRPHEQATPFGPGGVSPARFLGMARPAARGARAHPGDAGPLGRAPFARDPPLGPNASATQRHLALVYEEAVRAATALAAANNLLAEDDAADS